MIIKYEEQFKINQTLKNKKTNKKIQQKPKLKDENEQKKKKDKKDTTLFFSIKKTQLGHKKSLGTCAYNKSACLSHIFFPF
jgi:hypothetical protein